MNYRCGRSPAILGAILVTLVMALDVGDAEAGFYAATASGHVGTTYPCESPLKFYDDGGIGSTLAVGAEVILPRTFCFADVSASSSAEALPGVLKARVNAGGFGEGAAHAELWVTTIITSATLPSSVPSQIVHVKDDLIVTGTASKGSSWYGCAEAHLETGTVSSPECFVPYHADGSPISQTLHLDYDVELAFGFATAPVVLHFILHAATGGGWDFSTSQPIYHSIDLSHSAYVRQILPPGVTFESDSGFLSQSPFNSPGPGSEVPEPSSSALLGSGLALLLCHSAWRKLRRGDVRRCVNVE
jgi:hypothetical protein